MSDKTTATADVRRFTGYIAADGSHHATLKAAAAVSLEVKTRAALQEVFGKKSTIPDPSLLEIPEGWVEPVISVADLPSFLYDNRTAILAALNQEVSLRKPRKPRTSKVEKPARVEAATVESL